MTFLELVNDLRIEAGTSGRSLTTVEGGLLGETERLRKWIKDAWVDIQMQHEDWQFLWVQSTFTVPVNASVLKPPEYESNEVAEWQVNTFRMSEEGKARKDSQILPYRDYIQFRDYFAIDNTVSGKPQHFTIHPTREYLELAPPSDAARILFYDYWRTPQVLLEDDDEPIMPKRFHNLIVFWALKKYGMNEAAPEALMRAQEEINRLLSGLEIDQLPAVTTSGLMD